jgi:hypothetical protein
MQVGVGIPIFVGAQKAAVKAAEIDKEIAANSFDIGQRTIAQQWTQAATKASNYKSIVDFIQLKQIGMFRSNLISVQQLSELLYLTAFEFFNPDNVKIVLEINTYGNELLAHMPHVFDGKNDS